jgi:hypothetical protein
MSNPRSAVIIEEVVDEFFDDGDDDNDVIVAPKSKTSKKLSSAVLSVGISVASVFTAVLFINFIRVKYRKRRSKHKRGSKIITIATPELPMLKYNDYDFEDIEMMSRFRSDMYNIPEDDEIDTESLFKTSLSSLQPVTSIMVTEILDTNDINGIIYSAPKHTRRQTSHF